MMSQQKRLFFVISFVCLVGSACNLTQAGALPSSQAPNAAPVADSAALPTPTPIPSQPLGFRQGLALLNSYRVKTHIIFTGPTAQDTNDSLVQVEYSKDSDQYHMRTETTSTTADSPEPNHSISEQYRIGDKTCDFTPTDTEDPNGEIKDNPPAQEAMINALMNLFDVTIFVEDPVFVAAESVNGIAVNHFTFKVSGLAAVTGAEVTQSQGEYWVAQEGRYLVKYIAKLETRSAPVGDAAAEVMHLEMTIDLTDVDTPITISMPSNCQ
jgi:hypothetical protein